MYSKECSKSIFREVFQHRERESTEERIQQLENLCEVLSLGHRIQLTDKNTLNSRDVDKKDMKRHCEINAQHAK